MLTTFNPLNLPKVETLPQQTENIPRVLWALPVPLPATRDFESPEWKLYSFVSQCQGVALRAVDAQLDLPCTPREVQRLVHRRNRVLNWT